MRTVCVCVLLAAVIVGGCASQKGESYSLVGFNFAELDKVAILEVTGAVRGETVKNQIGTFFEMELMKRNITYNIPKNRWHNIAMEEGCKVLIVEKSNTHLGDYEFKYLSESILAEMKSKVEQILNT